jgi:hypothetical protein
MDATTAKRRSEESLRAGGIRVNHALPLIEEPSELTPRTARDVAIRAWVLGHIVYLGYGNTGKQVLDQLESVGLIGWISPRERELCSTSELSEHQQAWAAWHIEAVHGCAWALGMVDTAPLDDCPDTLASLFKVKTDPWPSIESASLRGYDEIYYRSDAMYRVHWAAVESRFGGPQLSQPEPAVLMRRHSIDWVAGSPYDWDEVPLDT